MTGKIILKIIIIIDIFRLRFWFEHRGQVGSFTGEQLEEIGKTSLARLLCDNTEIDRIQHYAFWQVQEG